MLENIKISYYENNKLSDLFELLKQWGATISLSEIEIKNSIDTILKIKNYKIIIAEMNNKVIGYAQTEKCFYLCFEPFIEVLQILVSEQYRSKGVGKSLMNFIENEAQKENIKSIKLHSQVQRSRAHVFYENLGYNYYKISKFYEKILK